ncbi:NADH-quinone oxidoreductase subunit G, partial [Streptomyces sp. SID10244]|nr:NADH-quinone oxidoreductase subunit G [Streptomyces sp. SID10244]
TAVLTGGRLTAEDAYAYSRFARTVLDTNDIDFRARAHSAEEADFLATHIAARPDDVTYRELGVAPAVLLVAFEPEEESPIVFLRMRRAMRTAGQQVTAV